MYVSYTNVKKIILASQCQVHDKKVHSVFAGFIERQGYQYGSVA
jgi:NADH pyrophosphatase NudC (nudix superfamily)